MDPKDMTNNPQPSRQPAAPNPDSNKDVDPLVPPTSEYTEIVALIRQAEAQPTYGAMRGELSGAAQEAFIRNRERLKAWEVKDIQERLTRL